MYMLVRDIVEKFGTQVGHQNLRTALAEALRFEDLKAKAQVTADVQGRDINGAWEAFPGIEVGRKQLPPILTPIDSDVWRSSIRWADDQSEWRWRGSQFSITYDRKPRMRHMMRGVHFYVPDVRRILGFEGKRQRRPGPATDTQKWKELVEQIVALERAGKLKNFTTKASLHDAFSASLLNPFTDDTLGDLAAWAFDSFVAKDPQCPMV